MRFRTLACGFALGAATALVSTQVVPRLATKTAGDTTEPPPVTLSAPVVRLPTNSDPMFYHESAALITTVALTQKAEDDADRADFMQKWKRFALPGEYHDRFEHYAGQWDTTFTMWIEGPDKPPVISKTVVSNKLIFGGRFLETRMRGTTQMEFNGEKIEVPIEGIGYRGYDNFKKKYVQFWIDNGGTGVYYSEGTVDESGKVVTYFATVDEWQSGERDKPCKMVETIVDEDTVTLVMYDLTMPPGKDRLFEERSTRRK